jgi:hypothetical protein
VANERTAVHQVSGFADVKTPVDSKTQIVSVPRFQPTFEDAEPTRVESLSEMAQRGRGRDLGRTRVDEPSPSFHALNSKEAVHFSSAPTGILSPEALHEKLRSMKELEELPPRRFTPPPTPPVRVEPTRMPVWAWILGLLAVGLLSYAAAREYLARQPAVYPLRFLSEPVVLEPSGVTLPKNARVRLLDAQTGPYVHVRDEAGREGRVKASVLRRAPILEDDEPDAPEWAPPSSE